MTGEEPAIPAPLIVIPAQAGTRATAHRRATPPRRHPLSPSFLRRQEPAQPPTPLPQRTKQLPQENSSLPPFRGEARRGVGSIERLPAVFRRPPPPSFLRRQEPARPPTVAPPPSFLRPLSSSLRPLIRHSCAGRNPHPPTPLPQRTKQLPQENSSLPPFRGEARWGVGGAERPPAALRHPHRSCLRRNDGTRRQEPAPATPPATESRPA